MSQYEIRESEVIRCDRCDYVVESHAAPQDGKRSPAGSFSFGECLMIPGAGGCCGTKLDTSALHSMPEGINESRSGSEDCVGVGRLALFGVSLSLNAVCAARPCAVDDVQHLCHARRFLASRNPQPIGESQPDRFYSMVELRSCRRYGHSGIAEHHFTWRTGGCGAPRRHRCSLDRARASKATCRIGRTVVAIPLMGQSPTTR